MSYAILAITLLTLILLVVSYWFNNSNIYMLYRNLLKNREISQAKDVRIEKLAKDFIKAIQFIINCQTDLDKKVDDLSKYIDDLSKYIDEQNTYVTFQKNQFIDLAKSDMLSARQEELRRTKELGVALERLMGVALTSRQPASPNDVLALENINNRIAELEKILDQAERADI